MCQACPRLRALSARALDTTVNVGVGTQTFTRGVPSRTRPSTLRKEVSLDTVTSVNGCKCGGGSFHKDGSCRACYMRSWRQARKVAGGPSRSPGCQGWFDWAAVRRAAAGEPVGRKLTLAERQYLAGLLAPKEWTPADASRLLGMEPAPAAQMVRDVAAGRVKVIRRGWLGEPA